MKKTIILATLILFVLAGCSRDTQSTGDLITVDVTAKYPKKELILQDFLDVEYIPLESNKEFITMAYIQAIGKDVIIVRNRNRSSDGDIFFFDRKTGKGLKKINRQGQGAEEYVFLLGVILDEVNNEVYVNDHRLRKIFAYDLSGEFKRSFNYKEGAIFDPVFNFDGNNLICLDYYRDFVDESTNLFSIISKQDGVETSKINIPFKEKKSIVLQVIDEKNNRSISAAVDNQVLIPYLDSWILVEYSSDTIYRYLPDHSMIPFLVRTPSIHSMEPETFLFPGVLTDRYYFMQTVKKEYDFETSKGWPRTDLIYDRQEKAIFEYIVYNDDFSNKEAVNLVYGDIKLINKDEIAFAQKLEAFDLIEAYEKGQLKGQLKEVASQLDDDSNAVIMIAKYKK